MTVPANLIPRGAFIHTNKLTRILELTRLDHRRELPAGYAGYTGYAGSFPNLNRTPKLALLVMLTEIYVRLDSSVTV